jgi:hypothetical protein
LFSDLNFNKGMRPMPVFDDNDTNTQLDHHNVGHFGFTAVSLDDLEASGYTLATIACDRSGSTRGFQKPMEDALRASVEALKKHPNSEQMMLRVLAFSTECTEIHGFIPLADIDPSRYDGILAPQSMTALFDACINGAEAAAAYGKQLLEDRFNANGILIVITDGMNNCGRFASSHFPNNSDAKHVAKAFKDTQEKECLESFATILIGVNLKHGDAKTSLEAFHAEAGFSTPMIALDDASTDTIAKIGAFISSSVSSTSSSLGTVTPSQQLQF